MIDEERWAAAPVTDANGDELERGEPDAAEPHAFISGPGLFLDDPTCACGRSVSDAIHEAAPVSVSVAIDMPPCILEHDHDRDEGDCVYWAQAQPGPRETGLDVAWAAAEAALPEGWRIYSVHRGQGQDRGLPETWSAIAHTAADGYRATHAVHEHRGNLVAALDALAALTDTAETGGEPER